MLQKLFGFDATRHSVRTEISAGLTIFLTMAYILAVNPNILSATGMDKGALFTTTTLMAALTTLLMAFYAKLPLGLAPGMGLNAFFAYTICLTMGYTWQFALTAVLLEGLIFILLTVTNLREKIVYAIPETVQHSIGAGIGLFIAFLGLQNAGIIIDNPATLVSVGDITEGSALLTLIGIILTAILLIRKVNGALLIGILLTTVIGIPMGVTHFNGLVSAPPSIEPIVWQFEWHNILTKDMFICVFTLLFVDMFDTIGTLIAVARGSSMEQEGYRIPLKKAFLVDAIGTTCGAMMGSSTITTFVESTAGIGEGGRTGLTSFTTAICFLLALFLSPFFLSVPAAATAPALILVGLLMLRAVTRIDFDDFSESIPAFLCILMMPLAYSISEGITFGVISYVVINLISGKRQKLSWGMYLLALFFILKFII